MATTWYIRKNNNFKPNQAYGSRRGLFSLKIHHGGMLSESPGRSYINGKVSFVDMIDRDAFSVPELNSMMHDLGYVSKNPMSYHFKPPDTYPFMDIGIKPLANDKDVLDLVSYVDLEKVIDVFVEHGETNVPSKKVLFSDQNNENVYENPFEDPFFCELVNNDFGKAGASVETGKDIGQVSLGTSVEVGTNGEAGKDIGQGGLGTSVEAGTNGEIGQDIGQGGIGSNVQKNEVGEGSGTKKNDIEVVPCDNVIVESESKSSWSWFLNCLGDDLDLNERSNFTFISDRQKGIIPAIENVFPAAEHRFCLKHIYDNMKSSWRGQMYKDFIWKLATTTTVEQFNRVMEDFKTVNNDAYEYLKKIPPRHWSRSHFSGRPKCDVLLNNMCEVFNRQLIDGREKPIILALEYTREYLMRRLAIVQKDIDKCTGPLTPVATGQFDAIKSEAFKYKATFNGDAKFQVVGPWMDQCVVNMENRTCSCRKWELTGMPCKHAVACIFDMADNQQKVSLPESYVDPVYWLNTWKKMYAFKIGPVTGRNYWPKSDWPILVKPPKHHVQIGRPKKKRRKSKAELEIVKNGKLSRQGKHVKCGNCQEHGHNKRKCTNAPQNPVGKSKKASEGSQARKTKKARVE